MKGFYLKLKSVACDMSVLDAVRELISFSKKFDISVMSEINGAKIMVHPNSVFEVLAERLIKAIQEGDRDSLISG